MSLLFKNRFRFAIWLPLIALTTVPAMAGRLYHHQYRARTSCGIPGGYHYGHDRPRHLNRAFAVSKPVIDEKTVTWMLPQAWEHGYRPPFPGTVPATVRCKSFHFPLATMPVDGISLEKVGITLFETGRLDATGVVVHAGGPDGTLQGNWVTIRLRAYAAEPTEPDSALEAPVLWEGEHCFWVSRGSNSPVMLIDPKTRESASQLLCLHFNSLTYIEVEMEYFNDR